MDADKAPQELDSIEEAESEEVAEGQNEEGMQ